MPSAIAELVLVSYCDVSFAGARACIEAIQWHESQGHKVVSEPLGVVVSDAFPAVLCPRNPDAFDSLTTVFIGESAVVTYAIIHAALLRTHAAATSAAIVSLLAQRGALRIVLLSATHQLALSGLCCQVCSDCFTPLVCRDRHS
jgi:hypothetical protein